MMYQAIITKYLGATNYRGSRVKATAQAGSVTLSWDDAFDVDTNHLRAARTLAMRLKWLDHQNLEGGALPDNTGYAFVLVSK